MVNIRKATINDALGIHQLGAKVDEFIVNDETVNLWPLATLKTAINSKDVIVLLAEEDNDVLGFIIAPYSSGLKKSTIENIYVSPSRRDKGIGLTLLNSLIEELKNSDCEYISTLVPPKAKDAADLYKSVGFSEGEKFVWLDLSMTDSFRRT